MSAAAATRLDHLLVALDFDDTITAQDCNDILLQQTTGDAWLESEAPMLRGEISRTAAFRIQSGLIRVPRERLLEIVVAAATLRDGFAGFLEELVSRGARVVVVSGGLRGPCEKHGIPYRPFESFIGMMAELERAT